MAFVRPVLIWLLTFALMSAFGWLFTGQTDQFREGFVSGMIGTLSLLYACHKLGVRLF